MASQQLDRKLSLRRRLGLKMHLLMCSYCRNYARQLAFLQRAVPKLNAFIETRDDIKLPPERKETIKKSLQRQD